MSLLKFRSSELVFLDCINFEHLFALVYLLLLPNLFLLYISFQYPLKSSEMFKVFLRFRGVLKKKHWKDKGQYYPEGSPMNYVRKRTLISRPPLPFVHICNFFADQPPPTFF